MQHTLNVTCFKVQSVGTTSSRTEMVQQSILIPHSSGQPLKLCTGHSSYQVYFRAAVLSLWQGPFHFLVFFLSSSSSWHKATSYLKEEVSKQ